MRPTIDIEDREELRRRIEEEMQLYGPACDLNHLNVSAVRLMHGIFKDLPFTGDISTWDVGSAQTMDAMFENCPFNGDISNWNVSQVPFQRGPIQMGRDQPASAR